jgi:hypothetical protein
MPIVDTPACFAMALTLSAAAPPARKRLEAASRILAFVSFISKVALYNAVIYYP